MRFDEVSGYIREASATLSDIQYHLGRAYPRNMQHPDVERRGALALDDSSLVALLFILRTVRKAIYDVANEPYPTEPGVVTLSDRVVPSVPVESVRRDDYTHQIPSVAVVNGEVQYPVGVAVKELPKNKEI